MMSEEDNTTTMMMMMGDEDSVLSEAATIVSDAATMIKEDDAIEAAIAQLKRQSEPETTNWRTFMGEDWLKVLEKSRFADTSESEDSDSNSISNSDSDDGMDTSVGTFEGDSDDDDDTDEEGDADTDAHQVRVDSAANSCSALESLDSESEKSDSDSEDDDDDEQYSCHIESVLSGSEANSKAPDVAVRKSLDSSRHSIFTLDDETIHTTMSTFTKNQVTLDLPPSLLQLSTEEAADHLVRCAQALGLKEEDIFGLVGWGDMKKDDSPVQEPPKEATPEPKKEVQEEVKVDAAATERRDVKIEYAPEATPTKKAYQEFCFNPYAQQEITPLKKEGDAKDGHEICFSPYVPAPAAAAKKKAQEKSDTQDQQEISFVPFSPLQQETTPQETTSVEPPSQVKKNRKSFLQDVCFNPHAPGVSVQNTEEPVHTTTKPDSSSPTRPLEDQMNNKKQEMTDISKPSVQRGVRRSSSIKMIFKGFKKATSCFAKTRIIMGRRKRDSMQTSCSVTSAEEHLTLETTTTTTTGQREMVAIQ